MVRSSPLVIRFYRNPRKEFLRRIQDRTEREQAVRFFLLVCSFLSTRFTEMDTRTRGIRRTTRSSLNRNYDKNSFDVSVALALLSRETNRPDQRKAKRNETGNVSLERRNIGSLNWSAKLSTRLLPDYFQASILLAIRLLRGNCPKSFLTSAFFNVSIRSHNRTWIPSRREKVTRSKVTFDVSNVRKGRTNFQKKKKES